LGLGYSLLFGGKEMGVGNDGAIRKIRPVLNPHVNANGLVIFW
jgi:hypothetical protein